MVKLFRDKQFYKTLFALAIPFALQDLIKFGLNLIDNIMVGALGETELSGVSLANQPFFLFSMFCFGLAGGGSVLITQYFGKEDMESVRKVSAITLSINLAASLLIGTLVLLFPETFMRFYTNKESLIQCGSEYLRIVGWTYFLYGISNTFILTLRSVRIVKVTLAANILSFITNVFLNWVFIFGNLSAPALGVKGAAIATLCARSLECLILILYVRFVDKTLCFRFSLLFRFPKVLTHDFFKYSAPVLFNEFGWSIGISFINVVLGHLKEIGAVACGSIASTVQEVATVFIFGISSATCVLIGNTLGEKKIEKAKAMAKNILYLSMFLGLIFGLLLFVLRPTILSLYKLTPDTFAMAMDFLIVTSCIVFVDSVSTIAICGVLRGGGDTRYSMLVDVLTLWLISLPLGFLGGFVFEWAPLVVYVLLRSDVLFKAILCFKRIVSNKWVHLVTRDHPDQLETEE